MLQSVNNTNYAKKKTATKKKHKNMTAAKYAIENFEEVSVQLAAVSLL